MRPVNSNRDSHKILFSPACLQGRVKSASRLLYCLRLPMKISRIFICPRSPKAIDNFSTFVLGLDRIIFSVRCSQEPKLFQLTFQLSSYPAIYHPNNSIQRQSTVSLLNVAIKNLHWHNFHFWVYHLQTHWKVHILIPVFGGAYILIQGCIYPDTFVQGCIYPDTRVHISWFLIYVFGGAYILIQRCIYPDTCVQGWNYPLHTE